MMRITPVFVLAGAAVVGAMLAAIAILLATGQPWLGVRLAADDGAGVRVAAVAAHGPSASLPVDSRVLGLAGADGETVPVRGGDLLEEPDVAESYVAFREFFARQDRLAGVLGEARVEWVLENGARVTVAPAATRPLGSLPTVFWVQLFVGGASLIIGAWVWSLRRRDAATRIFAAVGASTLTFSFAAAIYSTRELAIDGGLFRVLSAVNHFGALAFGACMIALFLVYPRRVAPLWSLWVLPLVFGGWWLADTCRSVFPGPAEGSHLPTFIEMMGILVAAGLQVWKTRGDLRARATLRWFALSVALGAGAFVLAIIAPNLVGAEPILSQGYAFLFFLLVFAGVALGVARYRLFQLEAWAFRILFYFGGVMLLVALDSVLIFALAMEQVPALSVSFIVVAFCYLPLRDLLSRRLMSRKDFRESLFRKMLDVALASSAEEQDRRWRGLLGELFAPLKIEAGAAGAEPEIVEDGVTMTLPGVGGLPALRLSHAQRGRKLFARRDAALAGELVAMLRHAIESRTAYEKGVAEERARIARDMHDNIGAQLLSALHSPAAERKDSMIRETLSDLRGIINNAAAPGQTLEELLAELRYETAERLEIAGVAMEWRVEEGIVAPLSTQAVHGLRSILREAVSNALKHAGASRVSVEIAQRDGRVWFTVEDDGRGLPEPLVPGNGLANIRARVAELRGEVEIANTRPGLRVCFDVPIGGAGAGI